MLVFRSVQYEDGAIPIQDAKEVLAQCGPVNDMEIIRKIINTGFGGKCPIQSQMFHDRFNKPVNLEGSLDISLVQDVLITKDKSKVNECNVIFNKWVEGLGDKVRVC